MKSINSICLKLALLSALFCSWFSNAGVVVGPTRIVSVFSDTHSTLSVRFYLEGLTQNLCGKGTRGWAYLDDDDNKWGQVYPVMLTAFVENRPIEVRLEPRFVNGSASAEFCQIILVELKH